MAKKTLIQLTDDLDGRDITDGEGETIAFTWRGVSYEIDLSTKNAATFDKAVAKYVTKARRVAPAASRSAVRAARTAKVDNKAIRAWAQANHLEVSPRGRISAEIVDRYQSAVG